MDIEKLEQLITTVGPEIFRWSSPASPTNPICGQPVSMGNIREINRVAHKYNTVYINMDEFFDGKRGHETFAGEGFSLELIRRYGIRVSELGDYSMEYDLKTPEQQAELANVVRFAIDRSRLTQEHLDYVIAAVKALYEDRESIPNMRIVWGHNLPMRHFHAFLEPYPNEEK